MTGPPDGPEGALTMTKPSAGEQWRVLGVRSIYESKWIKLSLAEVELPSGRRFEHHTVTMPAALKVTVELAALKVPVVLVQSPPTVICSLPLAVMVPTRVT